MSEFGDLESMLKALRPLPPSSDLRRRCVAVASPHISTYALWGIAALLMVSLALWSHCLGLQDRPAFPDPMGRHPYGPELMLLPDAPGRSSGEIFGKYFKYTDTPQNFLVLRRNFSDDRAIGLDN